VLEGEEAAVERAYDRIKQDPRHRAAVILCRKAVEDRQFGAWEMAFGGFGTPDDEPSLAGSVDRLVAEVKDANTRALFSGFARINRKAG
jgi:hypothetical protein